MDDARPPLQTEFAFALPFGYPDDKGDLHRHGVMRLATALDEIVPLGDDRVVANPAYVSVLLLARVVTRLGSISTITPAVVEGLFAADFAFLQDLYLRVNDDGWSLVETECPQCSARFTLDLAGAAGE